MAPPKGKYNRRRWQQAQYGRGKARARAQKKRYGPRKTIKIVADKLKITKCHKPTGLNVLYPFGNTNAGLRDSNWYQYPLCNLLAGHNKNAEANIGDNFAIDMGKRESSRIFHKNSQIEFTIIPSKGYLEPFQYRYVVGYFKGDDNVGSQELRTSDLDAAFPLVRSRMKGGTPAGRNDFYFTKISKAYSCTPKMVYDNNGSDDQQGSETLNALWYPKTHYCNMKFNRIRQFESDESDSLDGWYPFFAIQCLPLAGSSAFNAPDIISDTSSWTGLSNPSPQIQLEIRTWFQDIH